MCQCDLAVRGEQDRCQRRAFRIQGYEVLACGEIYGSCKVRAIPDIQCLQQGVIAHVERRKELVCITGCRVADDQRLQLACLREIIVVDITGAQVVDGLDSARAVNQNRRIIHFSEGCLQSVFRAGFRPYLYRSRAVAVKYRKIHV